HPLKQKKPPLQDPSGVPGRGSFRVSAAARQRAVFAVRRRALLARSAALAYVLFFLVRELVQLRVRLRRDQLLVFVDHRWVRPVGRGSRDTGRSRNGHQERREPRRDVHAVLGQERHDTRGGQAASNGGNELVEVVQHVRL